MSPRKLTKDDLKYLKAALRRSFARSSIRQSVEDAHRIDHHDPKRPRCQKWSWCGQCGEVVPTWTTDVDHKDPVQPIGKLLEDMTPMELYERIYCATDNLWALCTPCHKVKTQSENRLRRQIKKAA